MTDSKIILRGTDFRVGERIYVEARLFDELNRTQAAGVSPLLRVTKPDRTVFSVAMTEIGTADPGLYTGSYVFEAEGKHAVEVSTGSGESVFRHDSLYVSA